MMSIILGILFVTIPIVLFGKFLDSVENKIFGKKKNKKKVSVKQDYKKNRNSYKKRRGGTWFDNQSYGDQAWLYDHYK